MIDRWELTHPDGRGVSSSVKDCGYDRQQLRSLYAAGFVLLKNGSPVRPPKGGEASGKQESKA